MTGWKEIYQWYLKLCETKDRTEVQEKEYQYADKVVNYVRLFQTAKECGNPHPEDNWYIKEAKNRMLEAKQEYLSVAEKAGV